MYTTASKKAKTAATVVAPELEETNGTDCIASRTRQRKGVLTKAQISGPLELQDSPSLVRGDLPSFFKSHFTHSFPLQNGRNAVDVKGAIQLGSRMRPVVDN